MMNGVAVSKTFQILYRNEEVNVNDLIVFKVHMLVDLLKVRILTFASRGMGGGGGLIKTLRKSGITV